MKKKGKSLKKLGNRSRKNNIWKREISGETLLYGGDSDDRNGKSYKEKEYSTRRNSPNSTREFIEETEAEREMWRKQEERKREEERNKEQREREKAK